MFHQFFIHLNQVNLDLFILAMILFLIGIFLAPYIVTYRWNWLLLFPNWIIKITKKLNELKLSFPYLFLLIFSFNNLSLFFNLLIGPTLFLPFFGCILVGINLGVIAYQTYGMRGILGLLINPVSLFELPAAWISLALGMDIASSAYSGLIYHIPQSRFTEVIPIYTHVVIPLLFLGAVTEAGMISYLQNRTSGITDPNVAEHIS